MRFAGLFTSTTDTKPVCYATQSYTTTCKLLLVFLIDYSFKNIWAIGSFQSSPLDVFAGLLGFCSRITQGLFKDVNYKKCGLGV